MLNNPSSLNLIQSHVQIKERVKFENEALIKDKGKLKGYDCKLCNNHGFTMVEHNGAIYARACKCIDIRNNLHRIRQSGLEPLFNKCTFDSFETKKAWQKDAKNLAMKYCKDDGNKWFFIGGTSGIGKTHICTAICNELINKKSIRYLAWRKEMNFIKSNMNNGEVYQEWMDNWINCDVLYIDDFLKDTRNENTKFETNVAWEIINERYFNPEKIVIMSTELTEQNLLDVDASLLGRIHERAEGFTINNVLPVSENYRLKDIF